MLYCTPIPALDDNYIWAFRNTQADKNVYIVDPGEASPVIKYLDKQQLNLCGILITHHHADHISGVNNLVEKYAVPVYGPASIACVNQPVSPQKLLDLAHITQPFEVLDIPGHTLDHIAYFGNQALFCGDTLFAAGCGRVFEGTDKQMLEALHKIASLPNEIEVYCAHEYTLNNIKFAEHIDPENLAIKKYKQWFQEQLKTRECTLPSTLAIEKTINPFLRCADQAIIDAAYSHTGQNLTSELAVFSAIREWKNHF